MRMITRCPSCGTAFRITADQLAARDGQVRCGQCASVFDARAALLNEPDVPADPVPSESGQTMRVAPLEVALPPSYVPQPPQEDEAPLEAEPEFDFGPRQQSRTAAMAWRVGVIVLSLALTAQLAYAYRVDLITVAPPLRLLYEAICRGLGCVVPLPQYANLISIESSELAAERGATGLFTLAAVLRNRAPFAQAHPALELTLTDPQDRPVARRVLRPQQYLALDASVRDPGFPGNSEYNLKVHIDAGDSGATGYRLYAFYE